MQWGKIGINCGHGEEAWDPGPQRAPDWESGLFRRGLNRWWYADDNGFFVDTARPTASKFKDVLRIDIQSTNAPFGADTVEMAGGAHYNGHPSTRTIGHWIVASGFSNYGGTTRFHDPATTVYANAAPVFKSRRSRAAEGWSTMNCYLQGFESGGSRPAITTATVIPKFWYVGGVCSGLRMVAPDDTGRALARLRDGARSV